jgi:hypothetical protein
VPYYQTLTEWKTDSSYDPDVIEEHLARVDTKLSLPSGTKARFTAWERKVYEEINNALRRRYVVPMAVIPPATTPDVTKVPFTVKAWSTALLDELLLGARRDAGDADPADGDITARAQRARETMTNAADPEKPAHPELPLRSDLPSSSGVAKGGPFVIEYLTGHDLYDALSARRYL